MDFMFLYSACFFVLIEDGYETLLLLQVPVQNIASSDGGEAFVSSGLGEKQLHLWESNQGKRTGTLLATLSMKCPPVMLQCRNSYKNDGLVILSVSEAGVAYIWDLMTISQEDVTPSRIVVKSDKAESDQQKSAKKNRIPVIAARLHDLNKDDHISVIIAYGSPSVLQFNLLEVTDPGEEVVIMARDETSGPGVVVGAQENGNSGVEGMACVFLIISSSTSSIRHDHHHLLMCACFIFLLLTAAAITTIIYSFIQSCLPALSASF